MSTRAEEMADLLAYREREGLTYAELAEETGLAKSTLSWWSWRLRRESRLSFAEVVVDDDEGASPIDLWSGVSLRIGDVTVLVDRDFDAGTLARVLDVARGRC